MFGRKSAKNAIGDRLDTRVAEATDNAIERRNMSKTDGRGKSAVTALHAVNEGFASGTFTAAMGPSGSGKSTPIHCAAGFAKPSQSKVTLGDTESSKLKEPKRTVTRGEQIGFIAWCSPNLSSSSS